MGKLAFVFSGQGAQHPGMGKDFYEKSAAVKTLFDEAEVYRPGTLSLLFDENGAEALKQTENTQPCLYLADMAAGIATAERLGRLPDGAAGFSLGEIAALALAGAFTAADGFKIAAERGRAMAKASEGVETSMMAVVRIPTAQAQALAAPYDKIYPVNFNAPTQLAFAGDKAQLETLARDVKAVKGRGVMLSVSGAFHSPYMTPAVAPFGKVLEGFTIGAPTRFPVYANYTAAPYEGDTKETMLAQIDHPVQWVKLIERMAADGFDTFVETGVGSTLQKLISQILPEAKTLHVEDAATLETALSGIGEAASC